MVGCPHSSLHFLCYFISTSKVNEVCWASLKCGCVNPCSTLLGAESLLTTIGLGFSLPILHDLQNLLNLARPAMEGFLVQAEGVLRLYLKGD